MLGPLLVHQKVDFPAFNYFASTLIGLNKGLKQILAFGTDGDKAVVEALSHNFPFATQLHCFIHFRKNVETKLRLILAFPHLYCRSLLQTFLVNVLETRTSKV